MIVSSFWNEKRKGIETIISDTFDGKVPTIDAVRKYIDKYCPVEFRLINGADSLQINYINARLEKLVTDRPVGYSDDNGDNAVMPKEPNKFKTKF